MRKGNIGTRTHTRTNIVTIKYLVTDIEFDFEDSFGELSYDEQIEIRDQHLGVWEADNDDDMIDEITAASGWCIKNIYYDIQLK